MAMARREVSRLYWYPLEHNYKFAEYQQYVFNDLTEYQLKHLRELHSSL